VGGVVLALERVAEGDDEFDGGVRVDGEVKVAARHFVAFIDDQDAGALEEGGLPGAEAPGLGGGKLHDLFPLRAEFDSGDGELEVAERGGAEEAGDGMGLATAGEASDVDEADRSGVGDVKLAVQGHYADAGIARLHRVDASEHAVEPVLHVGDQILSAGGPGAVGVDGADREEVAGEVKAESGDSEVLGEAAVQGGGLVAEAEREVTGERAVGGGVVDEEG